MTVPNAALFIIPTPQLQYPHFNTVIILIRWPLLYYFEPLFVYRIVSSFFFYFIVVNYDKNKLFRHKHSTILLYSSFLFFWLCWIQWCQPLSISCLYVNCNAFTSLNKYFWNQFLRYENNNKRNKVSNSGILII